MEKRSGESATVSAEHVFADPPAQARELARAIATRLTEAVNARGSALLAVAGGSSPARLFAQLAQLEVPWSAVTVTLIDERWVPLEDSASNARLLREHLLVGTAAAARFVPLKTAAASPELGHAECEANLRALPLPFDAVVLGMGEDGHIASLFPHAAGLRDALDAGRNALCAPAMAPVAPHPRMTLTLRALLSSRVLMLQIAGAAKRAVLRRALEAGPMAALPVRAVLHQREVPVELWYSQQT